MKRILFLLTLSAIFLTPDAFALDQTKGYCMEYVNDSCVKVRYCHYKNTNGCGGYEVCDLENDKYACYMENDEKHNITYRTQDYVNSQILQKHTPYYTDKVVDKVERMKMSDTMYPDPEKSRYMKKAENTQTEMPKNYFKATDYGSFVQYQGPPRRDIAIQYKQPYSAASRIHHKMYWHTYVHPTP